MGLETARHTKLQCWQNDIGGRKVFSWDFIFLNQQVFWGAVLGFYTKAEQEAELPFKLPVPVLARGDVVHATTSSGDY